MSATIDERVTALEEWKNMQNGLLEATNTHLGEMNDLFRTHEARLSAVEGRLGAVEERLGAVEERLGAVEGRLDSMDGRLDGIEEKLAKVAITVHTESAKIDAKLEILIDLLRPKIVG